MNNFCGHFLCQLLLKHYTTKVFIRKSIKKYDVKTFFLDIDSRFFVFLQF